MNALENYNTQYKEYLDNKKKTTSTITVDKEWSIVKVLQNYTGVP